jgi:hypothetical protein
MGFCPIPFKKLDQFTLDAFDTKFFLHVYSQMLDVGNGANFLRLLSIVQLLPIVFDQPTSLDASARDRGGQGTVRGVKFIWVEA